MANQDSLNDKITEKLTARTLSPEVAAELVPACRMALIAMWSGTPRVSIKILSGKPFPARDLIEILGLEELICGEEEAA